MSPTLATILLRHPITQVWMKKATDNYRQKVKFVIKGMNHRGYGSRRVMQELERLSRDNDMLVDLRQVQV